MATSISISSNYAGSVAGEIVGKAFKEADTIAKGLVTVLPDVDYQVSLRKIAYSDGRTDYTCGFAPLGSVTLSEKTIVPKKLKNEQEICKEDLRQIWSSASMGFSAHNDSMPADVESALLAEILGDTAEATDHDIWQGVAATAGEFGGFIPLFTADGTVIKAANGITSLNGAVTKSNVISEIEKVKNAIPVALRRKADMVFGVSPDIANFYEQALVSAGVSNGLGGESMQLKYGSMVMEVINGLPDNTFVVFQKKNLYFATGLMSDHNEIRIKDMDESDLSGQVRFKMVYTAGVNYVNGEEIIWYLTTT
jgi:hypothetical protein